MGRRDEGRVEAIDGRKAGGTLEGDDGIYVVSVRDDECLGFGYETSLIDLVLGLELGKAGGEDERHVDEGLA